MKETRVTLKNGIKAVIIELPNRNLVATSVFVGAGGRYENKDNFGISHFIEHMVFKGTEKYPDYRKIAFAIEKFGGEENAGTSKDNTYYFNVVNKKYFREAFDVLAQEVAKPLFSDEEIEKEKGVVIEEIHQANDDPADFAARKLGELIWGNHALACDVLGPISNIQKFTRDDLLDYFKPLYVSGNMTIAVAGPVKSEEVIPELERAFSIVPAGAKALTGSVSMEQNGSKMAVYYQDIEQAHVFYAFKTLAHEDSRRFALDVLLGILGRGAGSVLTTEIREERGLAYTVNSFHRYMTDSGFCGIYAGLNVEKAPEAVALIKKTLFEAKNKLYGEEELLRAKEYIKGEFLLGNLENTADIAYYFGRKELLYPESASHEERAKAIDTVTAEEVRQVANDFFRTEKESLVVVGPFKDKEIFAKMLESVQ